MNPAFWILWAVCVALQVVLIQKMIRGGIYRQAPVLLCYLLVLFITGMVDVMLLIDVGGWGSDAYAARIYWLNDSIRQCGLLAVIVSIMYRIGARSGTARLWPVCLVLAFLLIGVIYRIETPKQRWTDFLRNVSFFAVLLNWGLWARLIKQSRGAITGLFARGELPARAALAFSAGAGIQLAGEAVGQSIRSIAFKHRWDAVVDAANYLLVLAHLACLVVWLVSVRSLADGGRARKRDSEQRADGAASASAPAGVLH